MSVRFLTASALAVALAVPVAGANAQPAHCPPGLAKKAVPCVPPGLAKQGWRAGDRLPPDQRYVVIDDYWRYGLPRPEYGTQYIRVENDVLRIVSETARIVESIDTIGRLLN